MTTVYHITQATVGVVLTRISSLEYAFFTHVSHNDFLTMFHHRSTQAAANGTRPFTGLAPASPVPENSAISGSAASASDIVAGLVDGRIADMHGM